MRASPKSQIYTMVREGRADQDEGHLEIAVFVDKDITRFLFMCVSTGYRI